MKSSGNFLCLHQLIEEQVRRTPDQTALVFERETLTYRELNRRANPSLIPINNKTGELVNGNFKNQFRQAITNLSEITKASGGSLNDIVKATIKIASPVAYDSYSELKSTGGGILIDETSNVTVGACMIQ